MEDLISIKSVEQSKAENLEWLKLCPYPLEPACFVGEWTQRVDLPIVRKPTDAPIGFFMGDSV